MHSHPTTIHTHMTNSTIKTSTCSHAIIQQLFCNCSTRAPCTFNMVFQQQVASGCPIAIRAHTQPKRLSLQCTATLPQCSRRYPTHATCVLQESVQRIVCVFVLTESCAICGHAVTYSFHFLQSWSRQTSDLLACFLPEVHQLEPGIKLKLR